MDRETGTCGLSGPTPHPGMVNTLIRRTAK